MDVRAIISIFNVFPEFGVLVSWPLNEMKLKVFRIRGHIVHNTYPHTHVHERVLEL